MAFLKRRPKPNPLIDVELIEKDYKNLYEALTGELNAGSRDTKETVIHFSDRRVVVRSVAGEIKLAFEEPSTVDLSARAYWAEIAGVNVSRMMERSNTSITDLIRDYKSFQVDSESEEVLRDIFEAVTVTTLQRASADFEKHEKVRSELINDSSMVNEMNDMDFFSATPKEISEMLLRQSEKERKYIRDLNVSGATEADVTLRVQSPTNELASDSDRFVYGAAEAESTLADMRSLSFGFVWSDILDSIKKLSDKGVVNLTYPGIDETLPEFDEISFHHEEEIDRDLEIEDSELSTNPEDQNDSEISNPFITDYVLEDKSIAMPVHNTYSTEESLNGIIVEPINDAASFSQQDDDGNFMYEMLSEEEPKTSTEGIEDSIDSDVRRLFKANGVGSKIQYHVARVLSEQSDLEAQLASVERRISESHNHLRENVDHFEELKFEKTFAEYHDDSEVDHSNFNDNIIEERQNNSNKQFFNVSDLEQSRFEINNKRRQLLQTLHNLISELIGENVQSVLHRIEIKLDGIEKVSNLAFHDPSEDDDSNVDHELLNALKTPELEFEDAPTFFNMVAQFGFDPLTVAKEITA